MLIMSCSMPKAGSGWYNHLTNDLLVAGGFQDKLWVRERYGLGDILKYDNCHISRLTPSKMRRLIRVSEQGNTFCVHTHRGPVRSVRHYMKTGKLRATYIYRDPRDVVLSAYEHGVRERAAGLKWSNFAKLRTVEVAVLWTLVRQLPRYKAWRRLSSHAVHLVRYEDILTDTPNEMRRLASFLNIRVSDSVIEEIVEGYNVDDGDVSSLRSLHFHRGVVGRFRQGLTSAQIARCNRVFRPYLEEMGYEV